MPIEAIKNRFNRALYLTFDSKKLLLTFCTLTLCGLLVVFFRALSTHASRWLIMSLTFLPIFLSTAFLLALGVLLIRGYYDEIKRRPGGLRSIIASSWHILLTASFCAIPLILTYLLLWILLGVFFLMREIPFVGDLFGAILIFTPFILNFCTLLLCILSLAMLFFVPPILALNQSRGNNLPKLIIERFVSDSFSNLLCLLYAMLPLLLLGSLLFLAAFITGSSPQNSTFYTSITWFFIMIPFAALLSPAVLFFFHFAAESHALLSRSMRKEKSSSQRIE